MANYENFWPAVATTAPVIALSTLVALPDTSTLSGKFFERTIEDWFGNPEKIRSTMLAAGESRPALKIVPKLFDVSFLNEVKAARMSDLSSLNSP